MHCYTARVWLLELCVQRAWWRRPWMQRSLGKLAWPGLQHCSAFVLLEELLGRAQHIEEAVAAPHERTQHLEALIDSQAPCHILVRGSVVRE